MLKEIQPIGTIYSPFKHIDHMPVQPKGAMQTSGCIEIDERYADGLGDLDGFSHIYLLYRFHKATQTKTRVVPFMDTVERGVFATRSPARPNHIGLSIVKIERIEGNKVYILGVDVLDGTPLLDIKPYIKNFDSVDESASGWMTASEEEVSQRRSDKRFV